MLLVAILVARYAVEPPNQPAESAAFAQVERVVDGDTLLLADQTRVRLQGIDTPETVKPDTPPEPWGQEATEFTRAFLAAGPVRLEFDRERTDQYGRTLAFVWVEERMLNEELLRAGLAKAKLGYDYSDAKKARFRRAEKEARTAKRGIWSAARPGSKAAPQPTR